MRPRSDKSSVEDGSCQDVEGCRTLEKGEKRASKKPGEMSEKICVP